MTAHPEIKVGQVWQDWDIRFRDHNHRRIQIDAIDAVAGVAFCTVRRTGRQVRIQLRRFKPNSTGYKLVE